MRSVQLGKMNNTFSSGAFVAFNAKPQLLLLGLSIAAAWIGAAAQAVASAVVAPIVVAAFIRNSRRICRHFFNRSVTKLRNDVSRQKQLEKRFDRHACAIQFKPLSVDAKK
jgi:hypothetical protein